MMFEHPWNIPAYDAESEKQSLDYRMKTQLVDWSEAPDWATCVVLNKTTNTFAWSDGSIHAPILRNPSQIMENADDFEIFEKRPCGPSTASDLLKQAEQLLTERGKQYDTSGQERSSAKIVAAFNTITGRDLTPGEGWLFLMLLKAVRFYSNTETPHRDSLEDLISYAALHAEEYLNDER